MKIKFTGTNRVKVMVRVTITYKRHEVTVRLKVKATITVTVTIINTDTVTITITVIVTEKTMFTPTVTVKDTDPVITTFKFFPKINLPSQIQSKSQKLIESNSLSHLRHRHSKNSICSHKYSVSQGKIVTSTIKIAVNI